MLQDIAPHKFDPDYNPRKVINGDYIMLFNADQVLLKAQDGKLTLPQYGSLSSALDESELIYLFTIDSQAFFLLPGCYNNFRTELVEKSVPFFRSFQPAWLAFAGITAFHLHKWYCNHCFCGTCAGPFSHRPAERSLYCPQCGNVEYPKIAPVVIVGVVDNDKIVVTKYSDRPFQNYALVAGFVEVGETFEDAVRREVMEEVGLKVKNIRYYKSQPWAFTDSLLAGFFAELDGGPHITLDERELAEALWIRRDEIPGNPNFSKARISLTYDMIDAFYNGTYFI